MVRDVAQGRSDTISLGYFYLGILALWTGSDQAAPARMQLGRKQPSTVQRHLFQEWLHKKLSKFEAGEKNQCPQFQTTENLLLARQRNQRCHRQKAAFGHYLR